MKKAALAMLFIAYHVETLSIQAQEADQNYRYTVSWDYWRDGEVEGRLRKWVKMEVRLNGKPIGTRAAAFKHLEDLPIRFGERIKLDLPKREGRATENVGHQFSSFIQKWSGKGALVDWYEGEKKYEVHTVTWSGSILDGKAVDDMDKLTWIIDGTEIGKGATLQPFIEKWKKKKDLVIQIAVPLEWKPEFFSASFGDYYPYLEGLHNGNTIRVYQISKEPDGFEEGVSKPVSDPRQK